MTGYRHNQYPAKPQLGLSSAALAILQLEMQIVAKQTKSLKRPLPTQRSRGVFDGEGQIGGTAAECLGCVEILHTQHLILF